MCGCLLSKTFAVLVHSSDCPLRPASAYRTLPPHTCQSDHDPTITLYSFIHHPIHSYKVSEYIGEYLLKGYARHPPSHRLSTPRITLSVTVWVDTTISSKQSRSSSQTLKGLTSKGCATVAQSTCTLSRFNGPSSPPFRSPPLPPSLLHSPYFIAATSFSCSTLQLQHQRTFS